MSTNTLKHISDKSEFKTFDPTGSNFDPSITNVQEALASISAIGVTGNIPSASETEEGIIRLATQQEVIDGTDNFSAVTPATLKGRLDIPTQATETYVGITRYATNAEAIAGTETQAAIVASSLKAKIDNTFQTRLATENATGVLKISTLPAALAGTDDTTAMTPLKTAQAIGAATSALPTYATATQTVEGIVRIATNAEVANGTLTNGVAISPSGLISLTSNTSRRGLVQLATGTEVSAGTDPNKAITPQTLLSRTGNTGRIGLLKTTTTVGSGDGSTALAYNANVLPTSGGTISGNLNVTGTLRRNGRDVVTVDQLKDSVPIGTIVMWGGQRGNIPSGWEICDGGPVGNQAFRNVVGSKWGSTGAKPDFRGLFPRGANNSDSGGVNEGAVNSNISGRRTDPENKGQWGLGTGVGSYGHGTVQAQQIRFHKHAGGFGEHDDAGTFGNTIRSNFAGTRKGLDWDNRSYFTNDGKEIDGSNRGSRNTLNSKDLIGNEMRPWTMSILFIIKVA